VKDPRHFTRRLTFQLWGPIIIRHSEKTAILRQPFQDDAPLGATIPGLYVIWNVSSAERDTSAIPLENLSRTWEFLVGAPANLHFFSLSLSLSLSLLFLPDHYRVRAEGRYVPHCRNCNENRTKAGNNHGSLAGERKWNFRPISNRPTYEFDRNRRANRHENLWERRCRGNRSDLRSEISALVLAFPFPVSLLPGVSLLPLPPLPPRSTSNLSIGEPLDKP